MQLTAVEARVLGALIEKEITTPEYYPLSLNALVNACNQKSSREPVMQLSDREVEQALRSLEDKDLVSTDHGSRVERYENRARTVFHLRRDETAVLCLLLLRGPQTPGELRSRADRLFQFDDIAAVLAALDRLSRPSDDASQRKEAMVTGLLRQPGSREQRFQQLLSDPPPQPGTGAAIPQMAAAATTTAQPADDATLERIANLEQTVAALTERLLSIEQQLGIDSSVA